MYRNEIQRRNDTAKLTLARSLFQAPREFSLLLVRCNYQRLEQEIQAELCGDRQLQRIWQQTQAQFAYEYYSNVSLEVLATTTRVEGIVCLYLSPRANNLEYVLRTAFENLAAVGVQSHHINGVMVYGLEEMGRLELSLSLLNQVRDQLSYLLPCPLVLWLTDRGSQNLFRQAPDVKSWAVTSLHFLWTGDRLQQLWQETERDFFQALEDAGGLEFMPNGAFNLAPKQRQRLELELADLELKQAEAPCPPFAEGFFAFLSGRQAYEAQRLAEAQVCYLESLQVYGKLADGTDVVQLLRDNPHAPVVERLSAAQRQRLAILFFHLSLLYDDFAQSKQQPIQDWEMGQQYLRISIVLWEKLEQWQWVAQLTTALGLMLRQLQRWQELEELAWRTIKKLDVYCSPVLVTQNYGLLAEVALSEQKWDKAQMLAKTAIDTHDLIDQVEHQHDLAWYYLVLAQTEQQLGDNAEAIAHLEAARHLAVRTVERAKQQRQTWFGWHLRLYRDILQTLHRLYWQAQNYRQAFDLQLEQQQCEQQWGWRIFFGATALPTPLLAPTPELKLHTQKILMASQRQQDIQALVGRLSRDEHKLTILHGASGVGKTSLLQAGLIPSLWGQLINAREARPILLNSYGQWQRRLLNEIYTTRDRLFSPLPPNDSGNLLELLRENGHYNLLTILIFDQFEQFLEQYPKPGDRQQFFQFLSACLQLPFVKIILSVREDQLSYLLEWETYGDLSIINDNLLDRAVRYHLGNLQASAAHHLLSVLSQESPNPLEPPLIDRLIVDLSNDLKQVRPIELQVIGTQLQQDQINTLEEYLALGFPPKQQLLERFLGRIIQQCGDQNRDLAWQFLHQLTDLRQTRPELTKAEILHLCRQQFPARRDRQSYEARAELILHIFVGSGLVLRHLHEGRESYQLVHDYLLDPIRHHYQTFQSRQLEERIESQNREIYYFRRRWGQSIATIVGLIGLAIALIFLARRAEEQRYRQWQVTQNAELMALSNSSEALFYSDQRFEALLESLRAAIQLKELQRTDQQAIAPPTRLKVLTTLEQSYFGIQEKNRLEGHLDSVFDVNVSPDGQLLASSGWDGTVRLWRVTGELLHTMTGHTNRVTRVIFAPDGRSLFSCSWDNTIKQWSLDGKAQRTLTTNLDKLTGINLSPDGTILAIASGTGAALQPLDGSPPTPLIRNKMVYWIAFSPDGQQILTVEEGNLIKLWDRTGTLQQTLTASNGNLLFATFTPDGRQIVSSNVQGRLTFWQRDQLDLPFPSQPSHQLQAHQDAVFFVSFSADGKYFATGSADDTVKVWSGDRRLEKTFYGHRDDIRSVIFHPKTQQVISASMDKTIRIWNYVVDHRVILHHQQPIRDLTFSSDGSQVITASEDQTLKLWQRNGQFLRTFTGHTDWVNAVAWQPQGELIASGSDDQTVRLWQQDGRSPHILRGHTDGILDLAWSPDGSLLASASRDQTVRLWSKEGQLLQVLAEHRERVNGVAFSPDGKLLATASDDHTVQIWQRRRDNSFFLVSQLSEQDSWITDVEFSGDGKYLGFSSYDNIIQLHPITYKNNNPQFGEPLILKGHSDSVAHLGFHPAFPLLATTTWNNQLQLWQLDDTLLKTLAGHTALVTGLSWSPDGQAIATASEDNTAIIWELNLEALLTKTCAWLNPYLLNNPRVRDGDRQLCQPRLDNQQQSKLEIKSENNSEKKMQIPIISMLEINEMS